MPMRPPVIEKQEPTTGDAPRSSAPDPLPPSTVFRAFQRADRERARGARPRHWSLTESRECQVDAQKARQGFGRHGPERMEKAKKGVNGRLVACDIYLCCPNDGISFKVTSVLLGYIYWETKQKAKMLRAMQ